MPPPLANPYTDDPAKAEYWELGYLTGLQDPDSDDTVRPYPPELLEAFVGGMTDGQAAAASSNLVPKSDLELALSEEGLDEFIEHAVIHEIAHGAAHLFKVAEFGLIGVVTLVIGIPADVRIVPLEEDFSEPYAGPEEDTNVLYVAVCPRTDHPVMAAGVTAENYWTGQAYHDLRDALEEAVRHGHSETLVARCSLTDNTCGPVWIARQ